MCFAIGFVLNIIVILCGSMIAYTGLMEMFIPIGGNVKAPAKNSPNAYQSSRKAFHAVLQS
jgi:hypothetical protein